MLGATLGAVVAFCCFLFASRPAWFPSPITAFGLQFDSQFQSTLTVAGIAFVLLHTALIGAIYLRRAPGPFRHSPWFLETLWTAAMTGIFLFLALEGAHIWAGVHPLPADPATERIEVYAHQFAWAFRYPGSDGVFGRTSPKHINDVIDNPFGIDPADPAGRDDVYSSTLKVPAGRGITLLLHSRDVIHDFFVRELRFKQDVVPGMEIPYRFRAEKIGVYEIACSELCGLGHSQMRATMEILPPDQFDQWKNSRSRAASLAATTK
jgi:cytochrome c oxidase subunit 2